MGDGYRINVDIPNNMTECFSGYSGSNEGIDKWDDDFVEAVYKELNDINIKYKDFMIDIDFNAGGQDIAFVRIQNDNFTDWRDDTQWYKFIEEANKEKENILNVINSEIIDKLNDICQNLEICKFPNDYFIYNHYDKSFYVTFSTLYQPEVVQLKFYHLDDIDFEEF